MPAPSKAETYGFLVGYIIAILSTVFRLGHRLYRHQLWWDDLWAFIAVFTAVFNVIVFLLLSIPEHVELVYSLDAGSFLVWSSFQFQPIIVWASRISIQTTVIRLTRGPNRLISKIAVVVLALMWVASAVTKVFYCGTPVPKIPSCVYHKMPSVVSLVCDVIATAWLIGWPIYILFQIRLSRPKRNLIIACFSTSALLGGMDIFHATNLLLGAFKNLNISGHVEVMVALVLCNVLVLVTYVYRVFRSPDEDDGHSTSSSESEISRSKREGPSQAIRGTQPTRTTVNMSQNFDYSTDASSSVGPLTTVYSSDNYSPEHSRATDASLQSTSGATESATSPFPSLSSKS